MYDVSISFAGEDRIYAQLIAEQSKKVGLNVFYDNYEVADLWGKDLTKHLDTIYRKKSKYCIAIISKYYKDKIWTRYELRSALAKAILNDEEYILPIRLDDTDIPGLPQTIGYLDSSKYTIEEIVYLLLQKLQIVNLRDSIYEDKLLVLGAAGIPCTSFVIDRRYYEMKELPPNDWQFRVAISFGSNRNAPKGAVKFVYPDVDIDSPFILAMHSVATKNNKLAICDSWLDARPYESNLSYAAAINESLAWLSELSIEDYAMLAQDSSEYSEMKISQYVNWNELTLLTD